MKKIVNVLVLFIICLFPIVGNAKTSVSYEWKLDDNAIMTSKDGDYYFLSLNDWVINKYSKEGNKLDSKDFSNLFYDYTYDELVNEKVISKIYELNSVPMYYNAELDEYYSVHYYDGYFSIYDKSKDIDFFHNKNFDEDLTYTKRLIGYEFEIYESLVDEGFFVEKIYKEGNYYIVRGENADGEFVFRIYGDDHDLIFEKVDEDFYSFMIHIDNNKIYYLNENTYLEVYDIEGNLLDTFWLAEYITDSLEPYQNKELVFYNFDVTGNNIVVTYSLYNADPVNDNPTSPIDDTTRVAYPDLLSLKFRLKYDVETSKENGKVNLENKIDENDREYVEIDIIPDPGYSIGKITVTDSTGLQIEVTDSKFYMPNSDVVVDVEFIKGEYLPIPDTGLGKSITLILIGAILIGLGLYTFNYVRQE